MAYEEDIELMRKRDVICARFAPWLRCLCVALFLMSFALLSRHTCAASDCLSISEIFEQVQRRYAAADFEADFFQESRIEAMGIVDTAEGHVCFRRPAMMRWHYRIPEEYLIISDGESVWIYRPADNQVMVGSCAGYFGDIKLAEFFTEPRKLLDDFVVRLSATESQKKDLFVLKLLPKKKRPNLVELLLTVSKNTFDILESVTSNAFGDKTSIRFSDFKFDQGLDLSLFVFKIPKNADVLELEGQ